jgi:hypothetical protein
MQEMIEKIEAVKERIRQIKERKEEYYPKLQKQLLNTYLEYKGNIRVFVRVRPILS